MFTSCYFILFHNNCFSLKMNLTQVCIVVIAMNICKVYTRPLLPVFVFKRDLDLATFLTLRAEACNIKGCFFPMKFYFVDDSSIICPSGFDLKLAFMDQEGLFRVGSINSNLSKKQIIENCIRQKEVKQATTPNYMKPTHSSAAKTKKPITPHPRSTPALLRPVQNQDEFLVTPSQDFSTSNIFTNDLSEISADSFRSAQISFGLHCMQNVAFLKICLMTKETSPMVLVCWDYWYPSFALL